MSDPPSPASIRERDEVTQALEVCVPASHPHLGARSERVRSGSRTPSLCSQFSVPFAEAATPIREVISPRKGGQTEERSARSSSEVGSPLSSPPKRARHRALREASPDPDQQQEDEEDELFPAEDREIRGRPSLTRTRFKTPASVKRRVRAAREDLLKCDENELRCAIVEMLEAKTGELQSNLSVVRSELRGFRREALGRLDSMRGLLEDVQQLAATAAADRKLGTVKTEWEEQLRVPWAQHDDVLRVERSPQLRRTLNDYVDRFVESAPNVAKDFLRRLFTRELSGQYLQPGSTTRVVWGLAYQPLPPFVLDSFRHLLDSRDSLSGQSGYLRANLVSLFGKRRSQRRDVQQDWLVEQATDRTGGGEELKRAARLVLIDGREGLNVIDRPLDTSSPTSIKEFVTRFGKPVISRLRALFPIPGEFEEAVANAIVPFKRDRT